MPFIVSGNSSYHNLHIVDKNKVTKLPSAFDTNTSLLFYKDKGYGYLELIVTGNTIQISHLVQPQWYFKIN